jgi:hypothetical protein
MNSAYFCLERDLFSENNRNTVSVSTSPSPLPIDGLAAPAIVKRFPRDLCPHRIKVNVLEKRQQVAFLIAEDRLVAALEEVAHGSILAIEVHGIALINTLEALRQRDVLHLDKQMDMIAHENISVETEMMTRFIGGNYLKVFFVIRGFLEDLLFLVTARDDMIKGAGVFDAGFSWHGRMLAKPVKNVNNYRFKSDPLRPLTPA